MARLCLAAGARPNFVKIAPLMTLLRSSDGFEPVLVHTGQHYDDAMSGAFFRDLEIPAPDIELGVGSGTHAEQSARLMIAFEQVLADHDFDAVVVVGDVNSTLACSVVAAKAGVPIAHVEAGLRSFDRSMPEEINRVVTDALSEILFTTSEDANEHLRREGHPAQQIHFVGNTMIDTLLRHRSVIEDSTLLAGIGVEPHGYVAATFHRPANVDDGERLAAILGALADLPMPGVLPMHPRTRTVAERAGLSLRSDRLKIIEPLGYLDFLRLQASAAVVVTDSGGIQEETTVLGVPCLTFRVNTERPVTITNGTNRLIGTDPGCLAEEISKTLASPPPSGRIPPLWDGHAADRIVSVLARELT